MKFTKEQAFESLKGILTNNGKKTLRMSEKSLNAQLDALIPLVANDEMELTDFVDKVKTTFTTMNSNVEKDNSDFVKQWEKDHPGSKPDPKPDPDSKPAEQTPEMKALLDRLTALEKENKDNKDKATREAKRSELVAKLKEKGVKDKEWIESFLGEVTITEDFDVDAKADAYLKIYNKSNSAPQVVTPKSSGAPDPDNNPLKAASELMKKRREAQENLNK